MIPSRGTITPQADKLDRLLGYEPLAIGDLILAEVLQGFDSERDFRAAQRLLTNLLVVEIGGREIAIQAAKNYRILRMRDITVRKTIDTMIATRCIESGYDLLHSDRVFDAFAFISGFELSHNSAQTCPSGIATHGYTPTPTIFV